MKLGVLASEHPGTGREGLGGVPTPLIDTDGAILSIAFGTVSRLTFTRSLALANGCSSSGARQLIREIVGRNQRAFSPDGEAA